MEYIYSFKLKLIYDSLIVIFSTFTNQNLKQAQKEYIIYCFKIFLTTTGYAMQKQRHYS